MKLVLISFKLEFYNKLSPGLFIQIIFIIDFTGQEVYPVECLFIIPSGQKIIKDERLKIKD